MSEQPALEFDPNEAEPSLSEGIPIGSEEPPPEGVSYEIEPPPSPSEGDADDCEAPLEDNSDASLQQAEGDDGESSEDSSMSKLVGLGSGISREDRKRFSGAARKRFKWLLATGRSIEEARVLALQHMQPAKPVPKNDVNLLSVWKMARGGPQAGRRFQQRPPAYKNQMQQMFPRSGATGIRVGIVPSNYPESLLTTKQLLVLQKCVIKRIKPDDESEEVQPKFLGSSMKPGYLVFFCEDKATVDWLKTIGETLGRQVGTDLKVLEEQEIPRKLVLIGQFPGSECESNENILLFIKSQNEGLNVDSWRVLRRVNINGLAQVSFSVDHLSAEKLKKDDFRINHKFGPVVLKPGGKFQKNVGVKWGSRFGDRNEGNGGPSAAPEFERHQFGPGGNAPFMEGYDHPSAPPFWNPGPNSRFEDAAPVRSPWVWDERPQPWGQDMRGPWGPPQEFRGPPGMENRGPWEGFGDGPFGRPQGLEAGEPWGPKRGDGGPNWPEPEPPQPWGNAVDDRMAVWVDDSVAPAWLEEPWGPAGDGRPPQPPPPFRPDREEWAGPAKRPRRQDAAADPDRREPSKRWGDSGGGGDRAPRQEAGDQWEAAGGERFSNRGRPTDREDREQRDSSGGRYSNRRPSEREGRDQRDGSHRRSPDRESRDQRDSSGGGNSSRRSEQGARDQRDAPSSSFTSRRPAVEQEAREPKTPRLVYSYKDEDREPGPNESWAPGWNVGGAATTVAKDQLVSYPHLPRYNHFLRQAGTPQGPKEHASATIVPQISSPRQTAPSGQPYPGAEGRSLDGARFY